MRDYVQANQEIGRAHVEMLLATPEKPAPEPDMEVFGALIDGAVNGPKLPDYDATSRHRRPAGGSAPTRRRH